MAMTVRNGVLVADDEALLRGILVPRLQERGFTCFEAADGDATLNTLRQNPQIGVVLIDIRMPGKSGLDVIAEARSASDHEFEFIVMTGHGGMDEAIRALRLGARDFLLKPLRFEQVEQAIVDGVKALGEKEERRRFKAELEQSIARKSDEISSLAHEIDVARDETLETLVAAAQHRDDETGMHIRRMGAYAQELARGLGRSSKDASEIGSAAMLHDVGKIGVPDHILLKPGPLTPEESAVMRSHTTIGHRIIAQSQTKLLRLAANIALHHHERWDGSGYPGGLSENAIPIEARITAVCDVYDALRSQRPYKPAFRHSEALAVIFEGDERTHPYQFDPEIMAILWEKRDRMDEIFVSFPEFVLNSPSLNGGLANNSPARGRSE